MCAMHVTEELYYAHHAAIYYLNQGSLSQESITDHWQYLHIGPYNVISTHLKLWIKNLNVTPSTVTVRNIPCYLSDSDLFL